MPDQPTDPENVTFFRSVMTKDSALDAIIRAKSEPVQNPQANKIQEMLDEFPWRSVLFEECVPRFIDALARSEPRKFVGWHD